MEQSLLYMIYNIVTPRTGHYVAENTFSGKVQKDTNQLGGQIALSCTDCL